MLFAAANAAAFNSSASNIDIDFLLFNIFVPPSLIKDILLRLVLDLRFIILGLLLILLRRFDLWRINFLPSSLLGLSFGVDELELESLFVRRNKL